MDFGKDSRSIRKYTARTLSGGSLTLRDRTSTISSGNTDFLIGGAINPAYYSTTGAFNGSGIAIASASFLSEGQITLFFQHHTGTIRYMQLLNNGDWIGGTSSEIVAGDARNGTPIAAVPYDNNGKSTWHVFCEFH